VSPMKRKEKVSEQNALNPVAIKNVIANAIQQDLQTISHHTKVDDLDSAGAFRFFIESQQESLLKKWSYEDKDGKAQIERLHNEALQLFVEDNKSMSYINDRFDFTSLDNRRSRKTPLEKVLLTARNLCHLILQDFTTEELFINCKHSSGATVGKNRRTCAISDKLAFPVTCTNSALPLFDLYLQWDPLYAELANSCSLLTKYTEKDFSERFLNSIVTIVEGSEFFTVEKSDTARRGACKEPTGNMFLQQGVMQMLTERLLPFLDLDNLQATHQMLARLGSIYRTIGTVDFSSASNRIASELVRFLVPERWFVLLDSVRSHYVDLGDETIVSEMISSMGNAFTFPLESLVFYSLACAVVNYERGGTTLVEEDFLDLVSVFGDDCILPSEHVPSFIMVCEQLGMKVNLDKTHFKADDPFRESCGGDYYAGHDVRPYSIKAPRNDKSSSVEAWLYIICNRYLQRWNSLTCTEGNFIRPLAFETEIFKFFSLYGYVINTVPEDFPDDSGIKFSLYNKFLAGYPFARSAIKRNVHGTISFQYTCFQTSDRQFICLNGIYYKKANSMNEFMDLGDYWYLRKRSFYFTLVNNSLITKDRPIDRKFIDTQKGGYVKTVGTSFYS